MKKLSEEEKAELSKALNTMTGDYYKAILQLLCLDPNVSELNYLKTPIQMHNGGNYVLALLHVSGPVLNLDALREGDELEATIKPLQVTTKK